MKPTFSAFVFIVFSLLPMLLIGQSVPFSVNYQAVARDADGLPVVNASVYADMSILKGSENGPEVYFESHTTSTNAFGLYILVIGEGSTSDNLSQVDWGSDAYFLKTYISIDNEAPLESVAKLNSVPYAFVSQKSVIDNVNDADNDPRNEMSEVSDFNAGGHVIAEHVSGEGTVTVISESVTSLQFDPVSSDLQYFDEEGTVNIIPLESLLGGSGGTGAVDVLTTLQFDPITNELLYVDEQGDTNVIPLGNLSGGSGAESIMQDLNNGKVIGLHTSANGTVTEIEETVTSLQFDPNTNQLLYFDENGDTNLIELNNLGGGSGIGSEMQDLNDGQVIGVHTSGNGTVTELEETVTTLMDNGDGSFSFISEDGVVTTISKTAGANMSADGVGVLSLDPTINTLNYEDENGLATNIDLCQVVDNCESLTALSFDSATNDMVYIDEQGNSNVIPLGSLLGGPDSGDALTTLSFDPATNNLYYLDELGTVNVIPLESLEGGSGIGSDMQNLNSGQVIGIHTSNNGTVTEIEETITSLIDNGDGTFSYTSEDGIIQHYDGNVEREVYVSDLGTNPANGSVLNYVALEGPEAAAYQRGESTLDGGEFFVPYSDHFKQTVDVSSVTIQLTPYSADTYGVAVVDRTDDGFLVKELMSGTSNYSFSWEVKAVRKGLESFSVSN